MTTSEPASGLRLEEVGCYNCGGRGATLYDTENGFQLVRCAECGLLYVSPRPTPEEITRAHLTGLHRGAAALEVTGRRDPARFARYQRVLGELYPDRLADRSGAWLDIGCGFGEFLEALQAFFGGRIEGVGCEPNERKRAIARERGLRVDDLDLDRHERRYEFVSLLNVYSHLPDPVATLSGWRKLLRPGGELLLETGHSSHLPREHHHRPYYLPDHLSFANREIVTRLLERIGYEIVDVRFYRAECYPELTLRSISRVAAQVLSGRRRPRAAFAALFPREPKRDLYVRARLRAPSS